MVGRVASGWRGGLALALVLVGGSGCSSSAENARETAVSAARSHAVGLREHLADAARGRSGDAQVDAVRQVLTGVWRVATADDAHVIVTGALTGRGMSGGGLTYEDFAARLCLRYRISPVSGDTEVSDIACPPWIENRVPADATVLLAE